MSKFPGVDHVSYSLSPGSPPCDIFMPRDKGLRAVGAEEGSFFIVPGLGSVKADYARFASNIAESGFTVYSPNCNEPTEDSTASGALERRAETLVRLIDKTANGKVRLIPHSLGGPVSVVALDKMDYFSSQDKPDNEVISISFMQPAGFDNHGPEDLVRSFYFYFREALPRTVKLLPYITASPRSVAERLYFKQRLAEVRELWGIKKDTMVEGIRAAYAGGIAVKFFLGPKDDLVRPEPVKQAIMSVVGPQNIIDIHPRAGHLTAQTHPHKMAALVLQNSKSVHSFDKSLAEVL